MNLAPDRDQMRRAIDVLHLPAAVIELRALHQKGRKYTTAGYFDAEHREQLLDEAVRLNSQGAAVYVVMNPLDPQLLARHANRTQDYASATATDSNVLRRHWLLIDVDPQRPRDTSATAEQLEAAKARARKVYAHLADQGWPKPVIAESGNGFHLFFKIDLPNDDASRDLIKGCLEALAARFDDAAVKIDKSVFNAARIVKLHGTVANKGDDHPSAPWRLSKLRSVPESVEFVSLERLQALAAEAQRPEPPKLNGHLSIGIRAWTEVDVTDFLARGNIESATPEPHDGAMRWKLKRCPFNVDHGPTESAVFLKPDGALGFKCLHNSCQDKHWRDLRTLVDGERSPRREVTRTTDVNAPASRNQSQLSQVSQPIPLIRPAEPAAPYPIEALGPILAPAARAVMEYVQVPDALAAHAVLSCAALAAQSHANVQTLGGARPLSLFMLTIAESGERKTASDTLASTPIREHRMRLQTTYKSDLQNYEAAHEGHRMRVKQAKEGASDADDLVRLLKELREAPPPRKPFFIVSEPTAEGLVLSLRDGQLSQALMTDEGGQFLGGHAMGEESELRTITLLSRLWDGSPIDRVRATDKEHTTLFGRRLAVHLMAQPEVANRMLGKSLYRSQGMLARFLICSPTSRIGSRIHDGKATDPQGDGRLRKYWHAVQQLLARQAHEDPELGGLDPPCLALSPEARTLLVAAHNDIEGAMKEDCDLAVVREFASKAAEHACRLAGVLTLLADPDAIAVTEETMHAALELAQAYIREHVRLAGSANVSREISHAVKLLEWIKRNKRHEITARKVMQLGPYAIREAPGAKAALRTLVEHGWLVNDGGSIYTVPSHVAADWEA